MRIRQEILLGIGGLRALQAVGIEPTVCHMNEGHSAFLALERIRRLNGRARLFVCHGPRGQHRRQCVYYAHPSRGGQRLVSRALG